MRPQDFSALQNADTSLIIMTSVLNQYPSLALVFTHHPRLFSDHNAIRLILLLNYLNLLNAPLGETRLDHELAYFLARTSPRNVANVIYLCDVLFEANKLIINHFDFFLKSENEKNLHNFTSLLGKLYQTNCIGTETIDEIFFP